MWNVKHVKSKTVRKNVFGPYFLLSSAVLTLAACNSATVSQEESIGFRQARYAELEAVKNFRSCTEEVLSLDRDAQNSDDPALYLSSAKLATNCEAELGANATALPRDERMRNYALVVQNNLKGGDIRASRETLDAFKQAFVGYDLYLSGGASFIDTMELLLGQRHIPGRPTIAMLNATADLKDELRRADRWGGF